MLIISSNEADPKWKNYLFLQGKALTSPRSLSWLLPLESDRIICWGWRSECYVDSAIRSATREATNENQLYNTALRGYFRSRFLQDMKKTQPAFVIDTVAPGSFHFVDPKTEGIQAFPELQKLIEQDYQMVSSVKSPDSCPRVYVIKSRAALIETKLVHFQSITAKESMPGFDPSSLDDGSVFESCQDYWLAPDGVGGTVNVKFASISATSIKKIAILNTRNGMLGDRSSKKVVIRLMLKGLVVNSFEMQLNRFPEWTELYFSESAMPHADAMKIDIISFDQKGGGLNELKVYRE